MKRFTLLICVCGLMLMSIAAQAGWYAACDRFGYTGNITVYDTLADAQNGTNARSGPSDFPQRDVSLFVVQGLPAVYQDTMDFLTAWSYTTYENTNELPKDDPNGNRLYSGYGNPSNTNTGFVQLYDSDSSTVTSASGGWTSSAYDTFVVSVTGSNAPYATDYSRLWHAPNTGGVGELTKGTFVNYQLNVTVTGLQGTDDDSDGFYESINHPTGVTGGFTGIFQNESTTDPSVNGFYVFNVELNMNNWAYSQGDEALNGNFYQSQFGAPEVPEPASILALMTGIIGLVSWRRRR